MVDEPLVAGEAEEVIDAVLFDPIARGDRASRPLRFMRAFRAKRRLLGCGCSISRTATISYQDPQAVGLDGAMHFGRESALVPEVAARRQAKKCHLDVDPVLAQIGDNGEAAVGG